MKYHHTPFGRKFRQFRTLSSKLNALVVSGKFEQLGAQVQRRLVRKWKLLLVAIRGKVSSVRLRAAVAGGLLLLGSAGLQTASAQSFSGPTVNPFGLTDLATYAAPAFADLDNDGDFDMLAGEDEELKYFENTGTAMNPAFGAPVADPWGITSFTLAVASPTFGDLDGDGDLDLLVGNGQTGGELNYFENIGTASAPVFDTLQLNPFGLSTTQNFASPDFVDLDRDGDLDLMVGEYFDLMYFENTGTAQAPAFAAPIADPFNIVFSSISVNPHFVDFDNDGDYDFFLGETNGTLLPEHRDGPSAGLCARRRQSLGPQFRPKYPLPRHGGPRRGR